MVGFSQSGAIISINGHIKTIKVENRYYVHLNKEIFVSL